MKKPGANGFTLMELMITMVVIAILAGIAYPNYTRYVAETRRSDATINLSRIAALEEKFFTECGRYADTLGVFGTLRNCAGGTMDAGLYAGGLTKDGHYTLTAVVAAGPPPASAAGAGGFTLTATPTAGSPQAAADAAYCATFTLNQAGIKTATGSLGGLTGGTCWKR